MIEIDRSIVALNLAILTHGPIRDHHIVILLSNSSFYFPVGISFDLLLVGGHALSDHTVVNQCGPLSMGAHPSWP